MTLANYSHTKLQKQKAQEKETDVLSVRVSCSDCSQEGWNELVGLLWVQSDWTPDT